MAEQARLRLGPAARVQVVDDKEPLGRRRARLRPFLGESKGRQVHVRHDEREGVHRFPRGGVRDMLRRHRRGRAHPARGLPQRALCQGRARGRARGVRRRLARAERARLEVGHKLRAVGLLLLDELAAQLLRVAARVARRRARVRILGECLRRVLRLGSTAHAYAKFRRRHVDSVICASRLLLLAATVVAHACLHARRQIRGG